MEITHRAPNGTIYVKTCEYCEKEYELRSATKMRRQRFCSTDCKVAAARTTRVARSAILPELRSCDICGETFQPRRYATAQKFCSKSCALRNAQRAAAARGAAEDRQCEHCGVSFRFQNTGNAGRFCSRACLYAGTSGAQSAAWKGGRHVRSDGYAVRAAPGHPHANNGYVKEHRLVMEARLGRYLLPGENVHHINGVKDDNRDENLELWTTKQPKGQRVDDKIEFALEILAIYRPEALAQPSLT